MGSVKKCTGCDKEGVSMQCPKCSEVALPPTFFCSQECFKKSWKTHKAVHSQKAPCTIESIPPESQALFSFTGPLRPGLLSAKRAVPKNIARPDYADHGRGVSQSEELDRKRGNVIRIADDATVEGMRKVCRLCREVLDIAGKAVRPGVTTDEIDRIVHEAAVERQCYPSPLGYYEFPKSVCTSINEVICHGIPDSRELQEGEIVNIDVSLYHGGLHGDINETYFVGKVGPEAVHIVSTSYACLAAGMSVCQPGQMYRNVGDAIEAKALENNCSVVRAYCGHGIGSLFHTSPNVPHYGKNKAVGVMKKGQIFTIEPMINAGKWQDVLWPDNWTSVTQDGSLSAQFEETFLVTDKGLDVLTARPNNEPPLFVRQMEAQGIPLPPVLQGLFQAPA